jgi:hypothetical protein
LPSVEQLGDLALLGCEALRFAFLSARTGMTGRRGIDLDR